MKAYPTFKETPIKWIGAVPYHWEIKSMKHLFSFGRGLSITKQDLQEDGIPCLNYGEIHSKYGFRVDPEYHHLKCIPEDYLLNNNKSLLNRGDFAFADTSEDLEGAGNFSFLDSEKPVFAGYHTVVVKQKEKHNYKFLGYFFDSHHYRNQIRNEVSGIKVFSITQGILKNTKILLPPQKEQSAIANFLDYKTEQIDLSIKKRRELIELLKEHRTAIINEAVTKGVNPDAPMKDSGIEWIGAIPEHWEVKRFKYWFDLITQKTNSQNKKIGLENIESKTGRFIETNSNFEGDGVDFKVDDILYGKLRPYLAKVYLSKFKGSAVGDFFVFRHKSTVDPLFAFHKILDYGFIEITNSSTYGAKMPRVSWEFISNLYIGFPDKKEQIEIAKHIETETTRIDEEIKSTQQEIDLLKEYRQSLIAEAVTGKIDVRDYPLN